MTPRWLLGSFQEYDTTVEVAPYGGEYQSLDLVLAQAYRGTAWARGVADMADAIASGRPHRASGEQAAHVVEILVAACADSMADGGRPIEVTSSFDAPALMPWAVLPT